MCLAQRGVFAVRVRSLFSVLFMESVVVWVNFLIGLFLSGFCIRASFAVVPTLYNQHALFQRPRLISFKQQQAPVEERKKVNTVRVTCHPDALELVIKADLFGVGAPVNGDDLRLGVGHDDFCRATASSEDEYRIVVGLMDCGTKHWMIEDSLVYTNLLLYSPEASPDGLIRMDEAVVPIECRYERKYSLSSASLIPTWIPFTSTQSVVETLAFTLRVMTDDWLYKRSVNVFYLGEPISMEASVRVGHHVGLRVFVSSCVATLNPDTYSVPRYVFIENGCLIDSQVPGSKSHFVPRTHSNKLQLVIDAFRFHNEDRGELYITCHLRAVLLNDAEAPDKACTLINGRWRSADGNDFLCGQCQSQNKASSTGSEPSSLGKFGPRVFGKPDEPEYLKRGGLNKLWEQEARVGPMLVLPAKQKTGEEVPSVHHKLSRAGLYSSQWRSGIKDRTDLDKGLFPESPLTLDLVDEDATSQMDLKETEVGDTEDVDEVVAFPEDVSLDVTVKPVVAELDNVTMKPVVAELDNVTMKPVVAELDNVTAAFSNIRTTTQFNPNVTSLSNTTTEDSVVSNVNEPKR
ncbi:zona pellucida sperm-binding protein 3-like isoform X2 [Mastacembelus armatus]|uniref:zona pellucida sperm-binding protein 3-like isoform X2 n=1 Tax=Mastacembelus armatus TaxID=205130 RepID=UPI000E461547|nr:zona pellucida sperm-binding protein 3-like isoform X2 [Mastacembelus armatus]